MGWLEKRIDGWASGQQTKELRAFLGMMTPMDGSELGLLVALATHQRHALMQHQGIDLMYPAVVVATDDFAVVRMSRAVEELQRKGDTVSASGLIVWVHTLRSMIRLELRQLGRDMWRQLERGFPHVDEAAEGYYRMTGVLLNTDAADTFPDGLTPNPK